MKEKHSMNAKAWSISRELSTGATDSTLQATAREKLDIFQKDECWEEDWQLQVDSLEFFAADECWDAGVQVGLLDVLKGIFLSEDKGIVLHLGQSAIQLLLFFSSEERRFSCLAYRCLQFFVETHDGLPAYLNFLCSASRLYEDIMMKDEESKEKCSSLRICLVPFDFLTIVMRHADIGASIARACWQGPASAAALLRPLVQHVLGIPRKPYYSIRLQEIQKFALQLPAMLQIWAVQLSLCSEASATEYKEGLGFNIRDRYRYEFEGMAIAELAIELGRPFSAEEHQVKMKSKFMDVGTYDMFVRKVVEEKRGNTCTTIRFSSPS
eukprot:CAMPEP_0206376120 /NCGR_PEP_ID=MMETSP0294-20121207/9284_1 /ASSEMBLY_ACC=CAM_ASM_000327 /TAXON_ID=39354 /ORGANISM="Heterosigma akashiwo, Strain CCMP2393" /LENGTH=324 /DNA_ID=CAMNT_0053824167 /DNA_START=622 /DNA_END=1599 /DNA_ORIENTATION=+